VLKALLACHAEPGVFEPAELAGARVTIMIIRV
jgi:hypothetical protein